MVLETAEPFHKSFKDVHTNATYWDHDDDDDDDVFYFKCGCLYKLRVDLIDK